jgi:peptidoglycan hydrolase-like protein with peptidoglycan-binding domain
VRDRVFNPSVVDTQLGTAVILKCMLALDPSLTLATAATAPSEDSEQPDDEHSADVLWVQQSLNRLGVGPQLVEDGRNGPRTMEAVSQFQQRNGPPDTGIAYSATIGAI